MDIIKPTKKIVKPSTKKIVKSSTKKIVKSSSKKIVKSLGKKIVKSNNDVIEKCKKNFCNKYSLYAIDKSVNMLKKYIIKNNDKNKFEKMIPKILEILKKKYVDKYNKICVLAYCNPGCKETIYQDGKEFPNMKKMLNLSMNKNLLLKIPEKQKENMYKIMLEQTKKFRNKLFNGKESILKNNFYEGLKTSNELRKKGAISGCTLVNMTSSNTIKKTVDNFLKTIIKSLKISLKNKNKNIIMRGGMPNYFYCYKCFRNTSFNCTNNRCFCNICGEEKQ